MLCPALSGGNVPPLYAAHNERGAKTVTRKPTFAYWTTGNGRVELEIRRTDARAASHPGDCESDVRELSQVPYVAKQLREIDPVALRLELKEYGAWDANELANHTQNLQRVLWLACGDIVDGSCDPE